MSHTPSLPLEIVGHILHHVFLDEPAQLKKCALVCWSFVPTCRKYLFATISLQISAGYPEQSVERLSVENLSTLLRNSPEIAAYTRHLELHFTVHWPSWFTPGGKLKWTVLSELKMFSRLESYQLSFYPSWDASIQSSLVPLSGWNVHLPIPREILFRPMPTLKTLKLERIENFAFHELPMNCPNIHELILCDIEEIHAQDELLAAQTDQLPLKPIKLDSICMDGRLHWDESNVQKVLGLRQFNGQPIFDISGLKHFELSVCDSDSSNWNDTLGPVLQTNQLTTFTLIAVNSLDLAGIGQFFLATRMTLKVIDIRNFAKQGFDGNPLHGLCEELEILGQYPNVLESLTYDLFIFPGSRCSTGDEWGALDRVIDTFTWPKLKKITIRIGPGCLDLSDEEMGDSDLDEDGLDQIDKEFKRGLDLLPTLFKKSKSKDHLDFKIKVRW